MNIHIYKKNNYNTYIFDWMGIGDGGLGIGDLGWVGGEWGVGFGA